MSEAFEVSRIELYNEFVEKLIKMVVSKKKTNEDTIIGLVQMKAKFILFASEKVLRSFFSFLDYSKTKPIDPHKFLDLLAIIVIEMRKDLGVIDTIQPNDFLGMILKD